MIIQLLSNTPEKVHSYCNDKVGLILLQDGIYCAQSLAKKYPNNTIYALDDDWLASGLPLVEGINLISADEWVNLCARFHPVVTIQ
jgi:sulfur relay protein TusB/DsrH